MVLQNLKEEEKRIYGIVDVENGVIYKVEPRLPRRLLSYVLILGLPSLGFLFAFLLHSGDIDGFTGDAFSLGRVELFYAAGLAGLILHILKKAYERNKDNPLLERIFWFLHIHEWAFIGESAAFMFVFYGLVAGDIIKFDDEATLLSAFLAGYFVDSLAEVLKARYNKVLSSLEVEIKNNLAAMKVPQPPGSKGP